MKTAITPRLTVPELVREYERAEADVRAGFALLAGAETRLNAAFTLDGAGSISIKTRHQYVGTSERDLNEALDQIRRQVWRSLVERLELRRMMSIERWNQVEKQIERDELPPITEASVEAFARGHMNALGEMLEEAVEEVFDWLRPRQSRYKTNTELEVGRRVVLRFMVDSGWSGTFRVNYHWRQNLTALENVLTALDGRGSVTKQYKSELEAAIDECPKDVGRGETTYFKFRAFKNGNLHLEFRRPDLLKRFNQIAGGRRLRPRAEAAE